MRALIIIPQYLPYGGAVANIVSNVILNRRNIDFDILTSKDLANQSNTLGKYNVFRFDNKQMCTSKQLIANPFKRGNISELVKRVLKKLGIKTGGKWIDKGLVSEISDTIIDLTKQGWKYDVYIPVVANPSMYLGVREAFDHIGRVGKLVVYQVDPIAGNYWHDRDQSDKWIQFESEMYEYADKVIIHPVQYNTSILDKKLLNKKAVIIEWPLLSDKSSEAVCDTDSITCFFSGYLDDIIRSPKYLIELLEYIDNPRVRFVFYSPGKKDLIYRYAKENASRIIEYHDAVPFEECMEAMRKASILINIGNNCINQMPSKLFDYISTGKPIINVYKHSDCPTLMYLEKYPLALNIFEGNDDIMESAKLVNSFITNNSTNSIQFSIISQLYSSCRSSAVVEKVEDVLLGIIND